MSRITEVYVIGAGGHAKVVIRALQDLGRKVTAVFDDDPRRQGLSLLGVPIVGAIERISDHPRQPTVIAIGDNATRRRIAERYDVPWMTVVHPWAMVDASVHLGRGTVVLAQAVVQVDSFVGDHVIVNHAATVDHDCVVASYAHLAPGVHLAGEVAVQEGVLIGVGAAVIPRIRIGAGTIVGAGAAVVRNLPEHVVAVGSPALIIKSRPTTTPWLDAASCLSSGVVSVEK
jgi:sugar O-acyltransferase (sialic acid O-acetyltransferase NeuD family)